MAVKNLAGACFIFAAGALALPASAQAINPRWHGTWQSSADSLVINEKTFKIGKESCVWSNTVPAKFSKTCNAYYAGSVTKASMMADQAKAENEVKTYLSNDSLSADQKKRITKAMADNRQVLSQISNDTFKVVLFSDAERENGSGDCGSYFFLDKESIYMGFACAPAPESFSLKAYRKKP